MNYKKLSNIQKGRIGEQIAIRYLQSNNVDIISTNYRTRFGEIDIIAKYQDILLFIEVKSRSSRKYGLACEAVDIRKMRKIISVAKYYLLINNIKNAEIRFDVIEIYFNEEKINYIKNAF